MYMSELRDNYRKLSRSLETQYIQLRVSLAAILVAIHTPLQPVSRPVAALPSQIPFEFLSSEQFVVTPSIRPNPRPLRSSSLSSQAHANPPVPSFATPSSGPHCQYHSQALSSKNFREHHALLFSKRRGIPLIAAYLVLRDPCAPVFICDGNSRAAAVIPRP